MVATEEVVKCKLKAADSRDAGDRARRALTWIGREFIRSFHTTLHDCCTITMTRITLDQSGAEMIESRHLK